MTDYERTTVRSTVDESLDPGSRPVPARIPADPAMRTTVTRERAVARQSPAVVLQRVVGLIFGVLQALIILRIVLLLLGANEENGIVSAIMGVTGGLVEPFRGIFNLDRVTASSRSVLDIAALVALVGWTLIEALILAVLRLGDRRVALTE